MSDSGNGLLSVRNLSVAFPRKRGSDVAVVGPHHVIDDLEPQEVDARVTVSGDDYRPDGTSVTRPVAFTFPPGVKLDQDPPTVEFRLTERSVSLRP